MTRTFVTTDTAAGTRVVRTDDKRVGGVLTDEQRWRRSAGGERLFFGFTTPQGSIRWAAHLEVVPTVPTAPTYYDDAPRTGVAALDAIDIDPWACQHCGQPGGH